MTAKPSCCSSPLPPPSCWRPAPLPGRAARARATPPPSPTAAKPGERPIELIAAELHTIKPRGLVDVVRFTGTTQPVDQTIVKARVAGRLAEVLVREGDHVTKGQVLARFETNELQARVNERQSALDAARAEARWTARDLADKETLAKRNIVSQSALDQARADRREQGLDGVGGRGPARDRPEEPRRCRGGGAVRRRGRRTHRQPGRIAADRRQDPGPARHQPCRGRGPDAGGRRRAPEGRPARHRDARRLRRSRVPWPDHAHQPDGAGRARARSRSMSRSSTATTRCAAACSPRAPSSSRRRAMRSPCPRRPCARTTQGDYVLAVENGTLVRKPVGAVRTWSRGELVEVKGLECGHDSRRGPLPGLKAGSRSRSSRRTIGRSGDEAHPDRRRQSGLRHHDDAGAAGAGPVLLPPARHRPVPQHRLPGGGGHHRLSRRLARDRRERGQPQDRGSGQLHRRHQDPDLALARRPVGRHRRVRALRAVAGGLQDVREKVQRSAPPFRTRSRSR